MGYDFEGIYKGTEEFPIGIFRQNNYLPRMHHHLEYELFYMSNGNATLQLEKNSFNLKKGDVYMILPGVEHCVINPDKNFEYYAIVYDSAIFGNSNETTRKIFETVIMNQKIILPNNILEKIKTTTEILEKNSFGKEIAIKNLVYEIFQHIIDTNQYAPLPQVQSEVTGKKTINNALLYIQEHYKENISLEDLLASTNYSKSHFIRLFKTSTNMNYTDYLNRYRIEKACRDLIYSTKNVTEIATENGFNNIQYFSKIFRKYMECTPKQYQKKWRQ